MYKIPVLHAVHPKRPNVYMHVYILPNPTKIYQPSNHLSPLDTKNKKKKLTKAHLTAC